MESEVIYDLLWAEFIDMYANAIEYRNSSLDEICDKDFKPNSTNSTGFKLSF